MTTGRTHVWTIAAIVANCAAAVALFLLLGWHFAAPVGVYVAIAGVIGVGVSLRKEPPRLERALWFAAVALLVVAEIRGIYIQDEALNKNLKNEAESFTTITNGLETAISGLRQAISEGQAHFDKTISEVDQAINTETGGDTFCYLTFSPSSLLENGKPTPQTYFSLDVERIGRYPLRDVRATIDDNAKNGMIMNQLRRQDTNNFTVRAEDKVLAEMEQARRASTTTIEIGNFGADSKWLGNYPANGQDREDFDVGFSSFNSNGWLEYVALRRVNGEWKRAILVDLYFPDRRYREWTKIDKDFPRKDGHLDAMWPRPAKGRAPWDH